MEIWHLSFPACFLFLIPDLIERERDWREEDGAENVDFVAFLKRWKLLMSIYQFSIFLAQVFSIYQTLMSYLIK